MKIPLKYSNNSLGSQALASNFLALSATEPAPPSISEMHVSSPGFRDIFQYFGFDENILDIHSPEFVAN